MEVHGRDTSPVSEAPRLLPGGRAPSEAAGTRPLEPQVIDSSPGLVSCPFTFAPARRRSDHGAPAPSEPKARAPRGRRPPLRLGGPDASRNQGSEIYQGVESPTPAAAPLRAQRAESPLDSHGKGTATPAAKPGHLGP